jgi:hypothetical protein
MRSLVRVDNCGAFSRISKQNSGYMRTKRKMAIFAFDIVLGCVLIYIQNIIRTIGVLKTSSCEEVVQGRTHLSLNATRMRSTSSSRWNAVASRLRSFSTSLSAIGGAGVEDEEAAVDGADGV